MVATIIKLVENKIFQNFIIGVIIFNAAVLGIMTTPGLEPSTVHHARGSG